MWRNAEKLQVPMTDARGVPNTAKLAAYGTWPNVNMLSRLWECVTIPFMFLQDTLNVIQSHLQNLKLVLNADKTKLTVLSNKNNNQGASYKW